MDVLAVAAAFALSCGLWWVYFHFAADAMRYALATARVQLDITRLVLSYGHLSFIGAVIVVAVGLRDVGRRPHHHSTGRSTGLLFGGTALYLATFGFTRWAMFRLVSWTRLTAAAVVARAHAGRAARACCGVTDRARRRTRRTQRDRTDARRAPRLAGRAQPTRPRPVIDGRSSAVSRPGGAATTAGDRVDQPHGGGLEPGGVVVAVGAEQSAGRGCSSARR